MADLRISLAGCLFLVMGFSGVATAEEQCSGEATLEISGNYSATSAIKWRKEEVPDQFITELSNITKSDRDGIARVAKAHKFAHEHKILRYSVDDHTRAGVVYKTDIGEVLYLRTNFSKMGGKACLPSDSVNLLVNGLPASLVFAKGITEKRRCLWNLQVFDLKESLQHSIYRPVRCMDFPKQVDAEAMVRLFNELSQ